MFSWGNPDNAGVVVSCLRLKFPEGARSWWFVCCGDECGDGCFRNLFQANGPEVVSGVEDFPSHGLCVIAFNGGREFGGGIGDFHCEFFAALQGVAGVEEGGHVDGFAHLAEVQSGSGHTLLCHYSHAVKWVGDSPNELHQDGLCVEDCYQTHSLS